GGDSPYSTRKPIGLTSIIRSAEPTAIRRFYHDWYRPDLMAVVIVGDIDKVWVERWVRERFSKITRPAHARERPTFELASTGEPVMDVYRGRVIPTITLVWKQPVGPLATEAAFRRQLV